MRADDEQWIHEVADGLPEPPDGTAQLLVPLSTYRYSAAVLGLAALLSEQLGLDPMQGLNVAVQMMRFRHLAAGMTADIERAMDRIAEAEEGTDE
jgi:hypothetical protein